MTITYDEDINYIWAIHLVANIISYSTVFMPGYIIYKFVERTKYLEKGPPLNDSSLSWVFHTVRKCYGSLPELEKNGEGLEKDEILPIPTIDLVSPTPNHKLLFLCGTGLQFFYLIWGILQEKVMTKSYIDGNGMSYRFDNSQFLVFVNRVLALGLAGVYLTMTNQPENPMPFYKYIYSSFSNVMSSWCQYEALKFISFPTQVLAKASKVIPVMLMARLVSKKKFPSYEYQTAIVMTIGLVLFMLESPESTNANKSTNISGAILLVLYIILDSFTSNWQDSLFRNYQVSTVQMMFGINVFSCLFTLTSLLQQNEFFPSIAFMLKVPSFTMDCIILSICSAAGQLLIFFTISKFGPVVLAVIMTIRQFLAIFLSYLIYNHSMSLMAFIGVAIFFGSVFLRQFLKHKIKLAPKNLENI